MNDDRNLLVFPLEKLLPETYLIEMSVIDENWIKKSVETWKEKPPDPGFNLILDADDFIE